MAAPFFQFKKFKIHHDKCAMKVGTDGVLLGAWVNTSDKKTILDVGTGSGLIALMLAQRSDADIDAIDIEPSACTQAKDNITESIYNGRVHIHHFSLKNYAEQTNRKYDLIVSNPPYFKDSLLSPVHKRNLARHNDSLSLEALLGDSLKILNPGGLIAVILPIEQESELDNLVSMQKLFFQRKTYVTPTRGATYKRILAELSPKKTSCLYDELTIEESRHHYTSQYIALTENFYLKM